MSRDLHGKQCHHKNSLDLSIYVGADTKMLIRIRFSPIYLISLIVLQKFKGQDISKAARYSHYNLYKIIYKSV